MKVVGAQRTCWRIGAKFRRWSLACCNTRLLHYSLSQAGEAKGQSYLILSYLTVVAVVVVVVVVVVFVGVYSFACNKKNAFRLYSLALY